MGPDTPSDQLARELLSFVEGSQRASLEVLCRWREGGRLHSALLMGEPTDPLQGVRAMLGAVDASWRDYEFDRAPLRIGWGPASDGKTADWCEEAALCDLCLVGAARWFTLYIGSLLDRVTLERLGCEAYLGRIVQSAARSMLNVRHLVGYLPLPVHGTLVPSASTSLGYGPLIREGQQLLLTTAPEPDSGWAAHPQAWRRLVESVIASIEVLGSEGRQLVVPVLEAARGAAHSAPHGCVRYLVVHLLRSVREPAGQPVPPEPSVTLGHLARGGGAPLADDLRDSLRHSVSLCQRTLDDLLGRQDWRIACAVSVARPAESEGGVVGASWSLPLGLALMAGAENSAPGVEDPGDLVATGHLRPEGHVAGVESVRVKLDALDQWVQWVGAPVRWALVPTENSGNVPPGMEYCGDLAKWCPGSRPPRGAGGLRARVKCVSTASFGDAVAAMPDPWNPYLESLRPDDGGCCR